MKLANLKTKRTHWRAKPDRQPAKVRESSAMPAPAHQQIHTYDELRHQIHDDLRSQHPEWVLPNGDCPKCDDYEARLMELLESSTERDPNEWVVALHRALEHGLN